MQSFSHSSDLCHNLPMLIHLLKSSTHIKNKQRSEKQFIEQELSVSLSTFPPRIKKLVTLMQSHVFRTYSK